AGLQLDQRGDQLQVVLDPVVDLVQQSERLRRGIGETSLDGAGRRLITYGRLVSRRLDHGEWLALRPGPYSGPSGGTEQPRSGSRNSDECRVTTRRWSTAR